MDRVRCFQIGVIGTENGGFGEHNIGYGQNRYSVKPSLEFIF